MQYPLTRYPHTTAVGVIIFVSVVVGIISVMKTVSALSYLSALVGMSLAATAGLLAWTFFAAVFGTPHSHRRAQMSKVFSDVGLRLIEPAHLPASHPGQTCRVLAVNADASIRLNCTVAMISYDSFAVLSAPVDERLRRASLNAMIKHLKDRASKQAQRQE